jgi:Sec-independent protein translocase protein TatA
MKHAGFLSVLFVAGAMMLSCSNNKAPETKDAYMQQYEQFLSEMEQNKKASDTDMKAESAKFDEFSKTYYEKFKDQLSQDDLMKIAAYKARYAKAVAVQKLGEAGEAVDKTLNGAQGAVDDAQNAVNDAQNKVNEVTDKAKATSDQVEKTVKDTKADVKAVGDKAKAVGDQAKQTGKDVKDALHSLKKK